VLEKVCEYFYYNEKHKNSKDVPDIDVPAELCLELLMAADYLNGEFFFNSHPASAIDLSASIKARGSSLLWNEALTVSPSLIGERTQNSEERILGREMPGRWLAVFEPNGNVCCPLVFPLQYLMPWR
jgi:hypothetical protein